MSGFRLPPYPYDRLRPIVDRAAAHRGGAVDLSIGTPCDEPPAIVLHALASGAGLKGYPPSIGTAEYRAACAGWLSRRLGVSVGEQQLAACVGTKEFVTGLPAALRLRNPARDTVLHPAVAYPSYAMGAELAGCRAVPVPVDDQWRLDLDAIDPADRDRALCLWVNTPGNPAGALDDLDAAAAWGRRHGVLVASDECYIEFTWEGEPRTILSSGAEGVLAVHSLSKRSNLAGGRVGFYAGDADVVGFLSELRKHCGLMVAAPLQHAGAVAWSDDGHVVEQRHVYRRRLVRLAGLLSSLAPDVHLPEGAFYLWVRAPGGDAWAFAAHLADVAGVVVSPGEFYGPLGASHVRVAAVQPDHLLDLVEERLIGDRDR